MVRGISSFFVMEDNPLLIDGLEKIGVPDKPARHLGG